jgi:anti-anti-sigma factor
MADVGEGDVAAIAFGAVADDTLVIRLSGELDIVSVEALGPSVERILTNDARKVVIDASGLDFMDSCGIALLLRIAARFGALDVLHPSEIIQEIILASGTAEHLRALPE